jgi:hypothetical protein
MLISSAFICPAVRREVLIPEAVIPVRQVYPLSVDKKIPPETNRTISLGLTKLVVVKPVSSIITL